MSFETKRGLTILCGALVLGIAGEVLLRGYPWGVNLGIWVSVLVVLFLVSTLALGYSSDLGAIWLLVPAVIFSAAMAWRDSPTLGLINQIAACLSLCLVGMGSKAGRLWLADVGDYIRSVGAALLRLLLGTLLPFVLQIRWSEAFPSNRQELAGSIARGTIYTIPVFSIFATLFAAADPVFLRLITTWSWQELLSTIGAVTLSSWFGGTIVWHMLSSRQTIQVPDSDAEGNVEMNFRDPLAEGMVVLVALNALFLAFVIIQLQYLFGGKEFIEASVNLTYAEYARRGFFELVSVAALVLLILLVLDGVLVRKGARDEWTFRAAAAVMVGLTFVIIASAIERMRLYQEALGLTELRVYTFAFMVWIAVLFIWFCLTILRGKREWFAIGGLVSGFIAVAMLNFMNPDATIVRANISRDDFDAGYLAALSAADSVPELMVALPSLPEDTRGILAHCLLKRWGEAQPDWRSWNAARSEAVAAIDSRRSQLQNWAPSGDCGVAIRKKYR